MKQSNRRASTAVSTHCLGGGAAAAATVHVSVCRGPQCRCMGSPTPCLMKAPAVGVGYANMDMLHAYVGESVDREQKPRGHTHAFVWHGSWYLTVESHQSPAISLPLKLAAHIICLAQGIRLHFSPRTTTTTRQKNAAVKDERDGTSEAHREGQTPSARRLPSGHPAAVAALLAANRLRSEFHEMEPTAGSNLERRRRRVHWTSKLAPRRRQERGSGV